ncbi:MAG: phosphotransferase family protein [Acidobacteriota bacterium]
MSSDPRDQARPVRAGEELDLIALEPFLATHIDAAGDALGKDARLEVEQFPGGYSNLTYLLRLGDLELVLRRPPVGSKVATAHDMGREFRVLSALAPIYPLAPRPLAYDEEGEVLGMPFYVMERRRGVILRRGVPAGAAFDRRVARGLSEAFVEQLAAFHRLDWREAGLGDLGRPEGYAQRQVGGWLKRYEAARTDDHGALDEVIRWLQQRLEAGEVEREGEAVVTLVHNDYKYDNLVLDPSDLTNILALLDWEMCTIGEARMDLGNSLAYWADSEDPAPWRDNAFGPTAATGSLRRRELAERYGELTGIDLGELVFYYVFGLFRLAVIGQQIYYRYRQGLTKDRRFAALGDLVGLCGMIAARALERDQI